MTSLQYITGSIAANQQIGVKIIDKNTTARQKRQAKETGGGDRRELILATTLKLIADDGIDAITHRKVASAAKIPVGSTTYYFVSRNQLLQETFKYYLEQERAAHKKVNERFPEKTIDSLVARLVEILKNELKNERRLMAEYELTLFAARDSGVADTLKQWDQDIIAGMAEILENAGATKPFDGARTVLHLIRGYEIEVITRHILDVDDYERRMKQTIASLLP